MRNILFILGILFIVASCNDGNSNANVVPCPKQDNSSPQQYFKLLENHAVHQNDTLIVEHIDKDGDGRVYLKKLH